MAAYLHTHTHTHTHIHIHTGLQGTGTGKTGGIEHDQTPGACDLTTDFTTDFTTADMEGPNGTAGTAGGSLTTEKPQRLGSAPPVAAGAGGDESGDHGDARAASPSETPAIASCLFVCCSIRPGPGFSLWWFFRDLVSRRDTGIALCLFVCCSIKSLSETLSPLDGLTDLGVFDGL